MSHFINSFKIDVPPVSAERFLIDPQPPKENPWQILDDYEYQSRYKLDDLAHRYAEDGKWYLLSVDPDSSKSEIRLNDSTILKKQDPVRLEEVNNRHCEILSQTLRDNLDWFLTTNGEYWEVGNTQAFYEWEPTKTIEGYSAYHGYQTSISHENGFYLTVDPTVKFISKHPVYYYLERFEKREVESRFLDRYCTLMSNNRPRVKLLSISDELTVSDETIDNNGDQISVLEYLKSDNKYTDEQVDRVDENEPIARVRFGWMDESESSDTAPSLLHPHPEEINQAMTEYSVRPADKRWKDTQQFVEQIDFLRVGEEYCDVSNNPRKRNVDIFEYPELYFGNNERLKIRDKNLADQSQTVNHSNWHYVVKDYLEKFQSASRPRGAPTIDVLHPEGKRDTALEIYQEIRRYVDDFAGMAMEENPGTVSHEDRQKLREWIQRHGNSCDGVLVVLSTYSDHYLDVIKELDGLPSQGIQLGTFRDASKSEATFDSELFTTAISLATKIGVRPFLLQDGLSADATIGMSVAGDKTNTAAAVLLSGVSGNLIYQTESNFATGSRTATKKDVARRITKESIADATDRDEMEDPGSVVFHKNGQFGDKEIAGITAGIEELQEEGYLTEEPNWCAVELSDGAEYRIYSDDRRDKCSFTGAYAVLDSASALVNTYGVPDIHQGTPDPLHCSVEKMVGDLEMENIASDLFALTFLNWGFPLVRMKSPLSTYLPSEMHDILATGSKIQYPPF